MEKDTLKEQAKEKLTELQATIAKIEARLKDVRIEKIWTARKRHTFQYFKIIDSPEDGQQQRRYIRKSNLASIRQAVQNEYYEKILRVLKTNQRALAVFSRHYNFDRIIKTYDMLPQAKKVIIKPIIMNDKEYAATWQNQNYKHKPVAYENFVTQKNEFVRSKSELIIADYLNQKNIPYHYEFPLKLKDGTIFHPDFYCLNVRTRQTFYWEHFGMMDNPEYVADFFSRLQLYSRNNIFPGRNLLFTMETSSSPLDTRTAAKLVQEFLL